jgi:hypothetical protein
VIYPYPATYWKGFPSWNPWNSAYKTLPTTLQFRSPASDPLQNWPGRTNTEYYVGNRTYSAIGVNIEFLSLEHQMLEQIPTPTDDNPDLTTEMSTLDSLYLVYGNSYPKQMNQSPSGEGVNVAMTYYHGRENAALVFSGMTIWDFRKVDCQALVDFVVGRLWGLQKRTLFVAPSAATSSLNRRTAAPTPRTIQRPPWLARPSAGISTFQRSR